MVQEFNIFFFLRKGLRLAWNWLRAFCSVGYTPHATTFLHNEGSTFTDEWRQEWSYAIARAAPRSGMKRERERIGLVVPPSRVDAFPHDSLLALCSPTEVTQHQNRIFTETGREMFFKKNFLPCIERK